MAYLDLPQLLHIAVRYGTDMATFLFKCLVTGRPVQAITDESDSNRAGDNYQAIECTACGTIHFVKPDTGKVLGEKD